MEALFRLALLRPPIEQDPEHPSLELAQPTTFQKQLSDALGQENRRGAAVAVGRAFIKSPEFVAAPEENDVGAELAALSAGLDALPANATRTALPNERGRLVADDVVAAARTHVRLRAGLSGADLVQSASA